MQDLDINFSPQEYLVPTNCFIDRTLWEHIEDNMSVPTTCKTKFYVPTTRAKKAWPEKLKQIYGVEPQATYESSIVNLPAEITLEEIEEHRKIMNKWVIKSHKDPTPVDSPKKISAEEYLASKRMRLIAQICFAENGNQFTDLPGIKKNNKTKEEIWNGFSEKEKRIYCWTSDYGFLWDHREGTGVLFPGPRDLKALKFETTCEYFFNVESFPGLILSLGCEPNTDRAIYGLRREARLDWPFDKIWTGVEHDKHGKPHPRYINIPDQNVEEKIVNPINQLIQNLEYLISK